MNVENARRVALRRKKTLRLASRINGSFLVIWLLILVLRFQSPDDSPQDDFLIWISLPMGPIWLVALFYLFREDRRRSRIKKQREKDSK